MARHFTLLALVVSLTAARAQFDALPDSNATWTVSFWVGPGYPFEGYFYEYDALNPDTVINGDVFKKVLETVTSGGFFYGPYYRGSLRDNGSGQVYFCESGSTVPALLYDFDVVPGDTVFDVLSPMGDVLVNEVDTVVYNGRSRKRIGLACPTSPGWSASYWIQGIGGLGGFFYNNVCGSVSGSGSLICMTENDTIQYGTNEGGVGACDIYLGEPFAMDNSELSITPNPSEGLFTMAITDARIIHGRVFDPQGREVAATSGGVIDLLGNAPGTYHLVVTTDRGVLRAPLMMQR